MKTQVNGRLTGFVGGVLLLFLLLLLAEPAKAQPSAPPVFEQIIQKGDRVLFVGDEMTQQMFYTRGVATALIAMRPDWDLRFFNGGRDGATAGNTSKWIDDLLSITKPTVVFVCLGLNDAAKEDSRRDYPQVLRALIEQIQKLETVRRVIVLSPVALDRGDDTVETAGADNQPLLVTAQNAAKVAQEKGLVFIDLFSLMRQVYIASHKTEGDPLVIGNRLPSEVGHLVVASLVLRGIGVTKPMLASAGWSPLLPRQMHRVRPSLAIAVLPPNLDAAERSRGLYFSIQKFDEQFFRYWRIAGTHPSAPSRPATLPVVESAWSEVRTVAQTYRTR